MLKKKELIEQIAVNIAHLKATVETHNSVHFFDLNVVSEDFFAALLNLVYGYDLENLNHEELNKAAVDLGDKKNRIAVQVTSQRTKPKIQKTLNTFYEHGLTDDYDMLKVLIIGDRTGNYPTLKVPEGMSFSGDSDVIDISGLMKDICGLDTEILSSMKNLIDREFTDPFPKTSGDTERKLDQLATTQRDILKQQEAEESKTDQMVSSLGKLHNAFNSFSETMLPDIVASVHQEVLELAREYLKQNKPTLVLDLLAKQKQKIWPSANEPTKAMLLSTMGGAKLSIGATTEAAELFLESFQYNPNNEKVQTNVAIAHQLLGDNEKAFDASKKIVDRNPANFLAWSILIQSSDEPFDVLLKGIPHHCRSNAQVALALGVVSRHRGDMENERHWLQIAADNNSDDHPDIYGTLGETILNSHTGDKLSPATVRQLTEEIRIDIEYALELFQKAISAIPDSVALRVRVTWLLNAAAASRLLGDHALAASYLTKAKEIAPDNPAVLYHSAIDEKEKGDLSKAIEIAESIEDLDAIPQVSILEIQLLWQAERIGEAIEKAKALIESPPPKVDLFSARQLLVELLLEDGQFEAAKRVSDELVAIAPNDVAALTCASQVLRQLDAMDDADAALDKACRVLSSDAPASYVFLLGNELGSVGRWQDAATVLERIVDKTNDSPLTRKYIHACFQANLLDKALEVCVQLRTSFGPLEYVTDIEVSILEEIGDITSARRICEGLIATDPKSAKRRVQAAVLAHRARDDSALDAFLDDPPDWRQLSIEYGLQIAQLCCSRKRVREAIELLYEMRRVCSGGRVHLTYLQTFLINAHDVGWLAVTECAIDVAVCIKDESEKAEWYIIEDRDDADVSKGELPLSHPLAKSLIGKKPDDSVVLKETPFSKEQGVITEIKSKFVHAFHQSSSWFEVRYPEHSGGFFAANVEPSKEGAAELLKQLSKQQEQQERNVVDAFSLYASNPLPIGAVGSLLHCDVFQAWSKLTEHEQGKVICASGTEKENGSANELVLDKKQTFVIGPVSLMTIHALSIADEVVSTVGRLGIVQTTIDLVNKNLEKQSTISRQGFMAVQKMQNGIVRRKYTEDEIKAHVMLLEELLEWIDNNCDVLAWTPDLAKKLEEQSELRDLIGVECFDTVLASCVENRVLYSDDLRLRQLANEEFGVSSVFTQPILQVAVQREIIDKKEYDQTVIKMASAGYLHTRIDGSAILQSVKLADWTLNSPFSDITWLLQGHFCDENSAVQVVADFLRQLWDQPLLPKSTDYIVLRLLDELSVGRNSVQVAEKMLQAVEWRFRLIPIALVEINKLIKAWTAIRIS